MNSIRRRLLFTLLPAILLVAFGSGTALYLYARHLLMAQFDATLLAKAKSVAASITWDDENPAVIHSPDANAAEYSRGHHPSYFQVWWADGTSAVRSQSLGQSQLQETVATEGRSLADIKLPDGHQGRAAWVRFVPVRDADDEKHFQNSAGLSAKAREPMLLMLASGRGAVDEPLEVLAVSLALAAIFTGIGTVVIVLVAVRRSLQPLAIVADAAARRNVNDETQPFPVERIPIEIIPICNKLNELHARIHAAVQRERRFTADVSHELRTPIAELKSLAEVALKFPTDADAAQSAFRDALAIAGQMESLVTTLLAMARSEIGARSLATEPIHLGRLLELEYKRLESRAKARGLSLCLDVSPDITVQSNSTLLRVIAFNLLSNAVDHSLPGGMVRVSASNALGLVRLDVTNTAELLTPADLPHLFEPFWQKDAARSSNNHFGLGLSLSLAYASALGCTLTAKMPAEKMLSLHLSFPST